MMADALADDRKLAIVMPVSHQLKSGPDGFLAHDCPLHDIGTLGTIHQESKLPDGRYHFVLHGQFRIELLEEIKSDSPYRQFRARRLHDKPAQQSLALKQLRRAELVALLSGFVDAENGGAEVLKFLSTEADEDWFANLAPFSAPIFPEEKQVLLNFDNYAERLDHLVENLSALVPGKRQRAPKNQDGLLN